MNRLELVMGLVSREETHSLLGVLKHCRTKGGLRLLRANLLQPPAEPAKINIRLDCVTELIQNPILFNALEVGQFILARSSRYVYSYGSLVLKIFSLGGAVL